MRGARGRQAAGVEREKWFWGRVLAFTKLRACRAAARPAHLNAEHSRAGRQSKRPGPCKIAPFGVFRGCVRNVSRLTPRRESAAANRRRNRRGNSAAGAPPRMRGRAGAPQEIQHRLRPVRHGGDLSWRRRDASRFRSSDAGTALRNRLASRRMIYFEVESYAELAMIYFFARRTKILEGSWLQSLFNLVARQ